MNKFSIGLLFSLTLLLGGVLLSASNVYTCYGASANQESLEKAATLLFLGEVAQVDLDAYNISLSWSATPSIISSYLYPGHIHTSVDVRLVDDRDSFKALVEFLDGEFLSYYLFDKHGGTLALKRHFTNTVDLVKFILQQYSVNFNASYCNKLGILLNVIKQINSVQEIDANYALLTVRPSVAGGAGFSWRFKMNSAVCRQKEFGMGIDGQNCLCAFSDAWRHYTIGNAAVNVSREEAISIALTVLDANADEDGTLKIIQRQISEEGAKIVECEANLRFEDSRSSNDCMTLDAVWYVIFSYDKIYSCSMIGFEVDIWADNGQISNVSARGVYGGDSDTPATEDSLSPPIYWLAAAALALSVPATALIIHKKNKHRK